MDAETFAKFIPYYLTGTARDELKRALADFDLGRPIYADLGDEEPLQGDGWTGLPIANPETGETRDIRGIVLSNSCDISLGNARYVPPKLTFAPVLRLADIIAIYHQQLPAGAVDGSLQLAESIRRQEKTDMFYLPRGSGVEDDSIVLLGDVHSIRLEFLRSRPQFKRLFSLNQFGHWLLLFKISVHFCRFHEQIDRSVP